MGLFHWHRWTTIAVQRMFQRLYELSGEKFGTDEPITEVLQRCDCGKLRTVTLAGHWTLEQVTA